MQEPLNGFISGDNSAERDDQDDRNARQVLHPAVAERELLAVKDAIEPGQHQQCQGGG